MKSSTGRIIFASAILFLLLLWVFVTFLEPASDGQFIATEATVISRPSRSKFPSDEIDTDLFQRFLEKYGAIPPRVAEVALALPPSDKKSEPQIVTTQTTQDNNVVQSQKVQRDVRNLISDNRNNDTFRNLISTNYVSAKLRKNVTPVRKELYSTDKSNHRVISRNEISNFFPRFYICDDSNPVQTDPEVPFNIKLRNRSHTDENRYISFKNYNAMKNGTKLLQNTLLQRILWNNSKHDSGATHGSSQKVKSKLDDYKVILVNCSQQRIIKKRELSHTAGFVEEERIERHGLCPSQPILSVKDGSGRLGSRLWQYAALWTLPRSLPGIGRLPFIPRRLLRTLRRVFVNISMPVLEDVPIHCKYRQQLMNSRPLKQASFRPTSELLRRVPPGAPVLLRRSVVLPEPVLPLLPELRRQLRFRPKLVAVAQHSLRQFREKRAPEAVDVRFVGTFVVRGKSIRANHFLRDPPGLEYLQEVLQSYRNEPNRTLFVVASDDLRWCKRHLAPGKDDMLLVHTSSPQTLALLAACNTSLVDQSDLGLWAALLSGKPSRVIPSDPYLDSFLSRLPGWSLLPEPQKEIQLPSN